MSNPIVKAALALAMALTLSCSSDDGGGKQSYDYCITANNKCLIGPFTISTCSGQLSNSCPYGDGSSSNSVPSSNSAVLPSPSSSSSITYTLACASVPSTGTVSTAITVPEVTCNGTTVSSGLVWTGAPNWASPEAGTYSNISVSAKYEHCQGETANCSGTLTVQSSVVIGTPVTYEGETYQTVVIGTQNWFQRNLNYAVAGSECYDNNTSNCAKYGRVYNWATAMALPSSCNSSTCASQVSEKHRGICPSGWHIPSSAEWDALSSYVQSNKGCSYCDAKHLKSADGWYTSTGNGLDSYSFSALPVDGFYGYWWSASQYDANNAYIRYMSYYYNQALWDYKDGNKNSSWVGVRCVKDSPITPSSSSVVVVSSSSSVAVVTSGKGNNISNYRTVTIGTQVWMAENLDYSVSGSKCYNNLEYNCAIYGRLYDWSTAMALPSTCNSNGTTCASQVSEKHRGICPTGWHIPSDNEWTTLTNFVGTNAGTKLKATSGWRTSSGYIPGTDIYGFAALPGGNGYSDDGFISVDDLGYWWSSSESSSTTPYAYYRFMGYYSEGVIRDYNGKNHLFSVRCLQD